MDGSSPSVRAEGRAEVPHHDWDIMSGSESEYFSVYFVTEGVGKEKA